MKKSLITILTLIITLFSFSSLSIAAPVKHEVKGIISDIYYQSESGYYVAHTKRDVEGRFWVLNVVSIASKKENKALTKQLKQMYLGKTVHIKYISDDQTDEETEIIATWIE
ncbi:hypothetical protein D3C87_1075200 [compost metagenome]